MFALLSTQVAGLALAAGGVWPLQPPQVIYEFDPPPVAWATGHRGVDLGGEVGQAVHSALDGTVSFSGRIAGRGVVVVSHGATRTTYEPVHGTLPVGTQVVAGQTLGSLELFGTHCLPRACLHWGLIEGSDHYLDPLSLIGCAPRPVRLLPLDQPAADSGSECAPAAPTPAQRWVDALLRLVDALDGKPGATGPS